MVVIIIINNNNRQVRAQFKEEVTLNGIMGYRYEMDESTWDKKNSECYCLPNAKKVPECLETGLMDIIKCQVLLMFIYLYLLYYFNKCFEIHLSSIEYKQTVTLFYARFLCVTNSLIHCFINASLTVKIFFVII